MRLWVSQIDVIAQEQQSESGGGVTGTQHAPVESQIETVTSVGAHLAPDGTTEPSRLQADPQSPAGTTEPNWLELHAHTVPGFFRECTVGTASLPLKPALQFLMH